MTSESEVKASRIYSPAAKWMHWGFIAVFAYGVIKQVDEVEELADFTLLMNEVLFTVLFLSILLVRYIYMRTVSAAMPPLNMPRRLILLAKIVQQGMYVSLTLISDDRPCDWWALLFLESKGALCWRRCFSPTRGLLGKRQPHGCAHRWCALSTDSKVTVYGTRWCLSSKRKLILQ